MSTTKKLIPATTGSFTSRKVPATGKMVTLIANGLNEGDVLDVQIEYEKNSFTDLYQNGTQTQLTSTNSAVTIVGPGVFRVVSTGTTGTVTVGYARA